jgi:uncharacterized protein YuzE
VQEELEARKIARALVDQLLQAPEQKVPEVEGITCFQSRVDIGGKQYLLRVMVNDSVDPPIVVTVYRTKQDCQVLEEAMKVKYNQEVDVLTIQLSGAPVEESDEDKPGVILDYDKDGNIVGIEILNASKRMENPRALEYAVA